MTEAIVIDVSAAQGRINWPALAASGRCIGAIIKATEGTGGVDQQFAANWTGAPISGMLLGAYHFARPSLAAGDAERQADHFVDTLGDLRNIRRFILALDIEVDHCALSRTEMDVWIVAFRRRVTERTGRRVWTYCGGPWWMEHIGASAHAAEHAASPLWIAAYVTDPARFVAMTPWRAVGWKLHQRSGNTFAGAPAAQHYPGIQGVVDTSVVHGPLEAFWALLDEDDAPTTPAPAPSFPSTAAHDPYYVDRAEADTDPTELAPLAELSPPDPGEATTDPAVPKAKAASQDRMRAVRPDGDPPQGAA